MHNLLARLLAFRQRQLSTSATICLLLIGLPLSLYVTVSVNGYFYVRANAPKSHEAVLISLEKEYYHKHGRFVLGTDAELKSLMEVGSSVNLGICPRGGHHSVIKYEENGIMYHCRLSGGRSRIWVAPLH